MHSYKIEIERCQELISGVLTSSAFGIRAVEASETTDSVLLREVSVSCAY